MFTSSYECEHPIHAPSSLSGALSTSRPCPSAHSTPHPHRNPKKFKKNFLDGHRVAARAHEDDGAHEEAGGAQEVLREEGKESGGNTCGLVFVWPVEGTTPGRSMVNVKMDSRLRGRKVLEARRGCEVGKGVGGKRVCVRTMELSLLAPVNSRSYTSLS